MSTKKSKIQPKKHLCKLMDLPSEDYIGGHIKEGNQQAFPILKGLAAFSLELEEDALRVPHWHPNCDELDYCIQGKARMTIVSSDGSVETIEVNAGDVAFIPRGYFHHIENIGKGKLLFLVIFNNEMPDDIGIAEALAGMPNEVLSATLKVPATVFDSFEKSSAWVTSKRSKKRLKS